MAVTGDPKSTKNTKWSPIHGHPSRSQCPAPEICRMESSTCSVSIGSDWSIGKSVRASAGYFLRGEYIYYVEEIFITRRKYPAEARTDLPIDQSEPMDTEHVDDSILQMVL